MSKTFSKHAWLSLDCRACQKDLDIASPQCLYFALADMCGGKFWLCIGKHARKAWTLHVRNALHLQHLWLVIDGMDGLFVFGIWSCFSNIHLASLTCTTVLASPCLSNIYGMFRTLLQRCQGSQTSLEHYACLKRYGMSEARVSWPK